MTATTATTTSTATSTRPPAVTPLVLGDRRRAAIWGPTLLVAVASAAVGGGGLRGADYPAHFIRAMTWERAGPSVWSNLWYAGHSTVSYSVLAPPAMALIGPFAVVTVGSVLATYCFARLTDELLPGPTTSLANYVFALVMFVNVIVGRAPFALGLAAALVALRAWQHGRTAIALTAATLAPLISPVAGAFLALAAVSVVLVEWRHDQWASTRAAMIVAAALVPLGIVTALFGGTGWFPFRGGHFVIAVLVIALVAATIRSRVVRCGAMLAAGAATVTFLIPNPLGGNFVRLAQIVAVPLAVAALASVRRSMLFPAALTVTAGLGWSLYPAVVATADWWGDESVEESYHDPLIEQVRRRNADGRPLGRLEIPFTVNHWESLFVATEVPFARGWERQVDLAHNPELYDSGLTADEYRAWLTDNGVRWVALPDTTIDHAGAAERRILDEFGGQLPWLRLVWENAEWQLYEVAGYTPIVDQPAELIEQGVDWLTLQTPRAATVTIRYHHSPHLTITGGGCVGADDSGWIVATLPEAGEYRLAVDPLAALGDDPCPIGDSA